MFKQRKRWIALGTLGIMLAGSLMINAPVAQAKSSTWKKVAIGAGIVTGYGLLKGKKNLAIGAGVVTGLAYHKYRHDKKREDRLKAAQWRQSRYRSNSSYRYSNGSRSNRYSNGYRHASYNGRSNGFKGKHKGWSKSKHRHGSKCRH